MASPEQVTMYRCYECGALLKSYFSAECCAQLDKRKRREAPPLRRGARPMTLTNHQGSDKGETIRRVRNDG